MQLCATGGETDAQHYKIDEQVVKSLAAYLDLPSNLEKSNLRRRISVASAISDDKSRNCQGVLAVGKLRDAALSHLDKSCFRVYISREAFTNLRLAGTTVIVAIPKSTDSEDRASRAFYRESRAVFRASARAAKKNEAETQNQSVI